MLLVHYFEEFFLCSIHNTIQVQIDDDVGDVEADTHKEDAHEGSLSISFRFVTSEQDPGGNSVVLKRASSCKYKMKYSSCEAL